VLSRRLILVVGVVTALSPLAWLPLLDDLYELDLAWVLLFCWHVLPFGLLAVVQSETPMSRAGSLVVLGLLTAATAASDVGLLLYSDDAQTPIALVAMPIYLSVGVGLAIGVDSLVQAVARRLRRRPTAAPGGS
jgi:hypothetical protein